MITLTSRQIEVIQFLLSKSEYVTIETLSSIFSVCPRTIRYDLAQIKAFLVEHEIRFESKPNRGSRILTSSAEFILLKKVIHTSRALSPNDRHTIVSLSLLINSSVTFDYLAELCSVTKQTIISSFQTIEDEFKRNNIVLFKEKGFGIKILSDEYWIRDNFIRLISEIKIEEWLLEHTLSSIYTNQHLDVARQIIRQVEKEMNVYYLDQQKIEISLCYCLHRISTNHYLESVDFTSEIPKIEKHPDFDHLLDALSPFPISTNEKIYFCWIFMSEKFNQLAADGYVQRDDVEANQIALFLIEKLQLIHPINAQSKNKFVSGLSLHLKVALYRIRNNIGIQNELLDQIKISIPLIYEYTKNQLLVCEKNHNVVFDENEIAYISMYVASAYEDSLKIDAQLNVLLVCSFGVATSSILKTRIDHSLPECNILGPIPKNEAYSFLESHHVDLIISTNEFDFKDIPAITVNPLIYPDDIEYIKTRLFQLSYSHMCSHFLQSYAHLSKSDHTKIYIRNLVDYDHIQIVDSCESWESAVHIAVRPLLEKKIIEPRYVNKMIDAINKLGTYMVLVPETAFIHAGTEDGIQENCTAILVLKEPIVFGCKNAKVIRNLVLLGIKDKDENSLLDLVYIFEKKSNLEILSTDSITKDIVYNLHD